MGVWGVGRDDAGTREGDGVPCVTLLGLGDSAVARLGIVVGWF